MRNRWVAIARGDEPPDLVLAGGRVLSVFTGEVFSANVAIADDHIVGVGAYDGPRRYDVSGHFLIPGFIDGHCHIESSKLSPAEFARTVVPLGTTGVVVDPHELANVLGTGGVDYMLEASEGLPLQVYVTLPSCVPASEFESPAQRLEACDCVELLTHPRVVGIAEMMNYPAAVAGEPAVMAKMALTNFEHVDGHAPGLSGKELNAYITSGPSSDHECIGVEEALEKKRLGMWIMIREASMIRNLVDLLPLVVHYGTENCMFVTDDREAGTLLGEGHMNSMVRTAVSHGLPIGDAVKLASLNVARYHGLPATGAIAPGYSADIAVVPDLVDFRPSAVFSRGKLVAERGEALPFDSTTTPPHMTRTVHLGRVEPDMFRVPAVAPGHIHVIDLVPEQVVTLAGTAGIVPRNGFITSDVEQDLVKVAVVERHRATGRVGSAFVRGFGLRVGAFASTVAHDAHNVVVAGMEDDDMAIAVRRLGDIGGGLVVVRGGKVEGELALPIAGLMSAEPASEVAADLDVLHQLLASMGVTIGTPFMYLSFLALSVIPEIRVTDLGLVDVRSFQLVPLAIS